MLDKSKVKEHGEVISSDKTVAKVAHIEGADKIKPTKQSSPEGDDHDFISIAWNRPRGWKRPRYQIGAEISAHWEHEERRLNNTPCTTVLSRVEHRSLLLGTFVLPGPELTPFWESRNASDPA